MSGEVIVGEGSEDKPEKVSSKAGEGTSESPSHSVEETSKDAYQKLKAEGEIGEQCQEVFEALQDTPYIPTIDELAHGELEGWQKSTISGRLNDLKDLDLVTDLKGEAKRKSQHSGIKSKVWMVKDE